MNNEDQKWLDWRSDQVDMDLEHLEKPPMNKGLIRLNNSSLPEIVYIARHIYQDLDGHPFNSGFYEKDILPFRKWLVEVELTTDVSGVG